MKVIILKENLEKFSSILTRNISSSQQVPILSNIYLKAQKQGFFIQATDLDLGIEVKIPAKIDEEGETTIPGKQFIEAATSLPQDKIEIVTTDNKLHIKSRKQKATFQITPSDDFPTLFEEKGDEVASYSKKEVDDIFIKLMFSTSPDDTRPELTGVLLNNKPKEVDYISTDGFRLSKKTTAGKKINSDEKIILPQKLLNEFISLKSGGTMHINKKGNQIVFSTPEVTLVSRMLHGNYPNYEKVIPKSKDCTLKVSREELLQSLKLSSVFARDNSNIVRWSVEKDSLTIHASTQGIGEQESELEAEVEGTPLNISFNAKYLSDVLKILKGEVITIEMSTPHDPAVFKDDQDKDFLHVIMPIRV